MLSSIRTHSEIEVRPRIHLTLSFHCFILFLVVFNDRIELRAFRDKIAPYSVSTDLMRGEWYYASAYLGSFVKGSSYVATGVH